MWWLYVPMQFDDFAICLIIQEEPGRLPAPSTTAPGSGRTAGSSSSAGRRIDIATPPAPGRRPTRITCTTPDGKPVVLEVESRLAVPVHVGGGYGGDPDWTHGAWKGDGFTERVTYDMDDQAVQGRFMFGAHRPRRPRDLAEAAPQEGWGLFEHGVIGRHDPSGFTDFFTLAP